MQDNDWCLHVVFWREDAPMINKPFILNSCKPYVIAPFTHRNLLGNENCFHKAVNVIYHVDMYKISEINATVAPHEASRVTAARREPLHFFALRVSTPGGKLK